MPNGNGVGALWARLPLTVRVLIVVGSIFGAGFTSRDAIGALQNERATYKAYVDSLRLDVSELRAETANFGPFSRYMLCWTTRQTEERSVEGCERSLIGTSLWGVLQEERGAR